MNAIMQATLKSIILSTVFFAGFVVSGFGQKLSADLRVKVDDVIATAYRAATLKFPCKAKPRGKAKILRWQDIEKCVNYAHDRVDWAGLSLQLQKIREAGRVDAVSMTEAIEASLSAQALPYSQVFIVKEGKALLPLSNSLLKFLPANSLMNLPVYDTKRELLGSFSGVYAFEKSGGLASANSYRMSSFQYTDLKGEMQAPAEKFLIDLYGVPWKDAQSQPGFRLPSDKLVLKN
jgi:hypothetical protein